ncbi:calhepatin-like isoform X1 [Protopterus annectens]|uniref:calhepatin-like isoform X1 n=1 Tax=Protopterus annectens TaxID=7888 RepID=UPI001CFBFC6F|nr:calhepatin-like isoform X1 [Protopterus annectens]
MSDKSKQQQQQQTQDITQRLRARFQQLDTDKSGSLSKDELYEVLSQENKDITMSIVEGIIKLVDENRDGQVSWSEFINAYTQKKFAK